MITDANNLSRHKPRPPGAAPPASDAMARPRAASAVAAALLAAALSFSSAAAAAAGRPRRFAVEGDAFLLDGAPVQIVSGAIHYW